MINNRQNNRRRGRGSGPRMPGTSNPGNRQDNRSRGNAVQLHEKYKAMARDAQLAGDRVQTEYFLQFADHYFRVLNENRSRFEEQRRQRDDYASDEDEDQDDGLQAEDGEDNEAEAPRVERAAGRAERPDRSERPERAERRPRRPRERQERVAEEESISERISADILPPAIAPSNDEDGETRPVRRRTRRPRPEDETEVAPAA
ncbi:DUF4167 domain-containing protein [Allosphingosinicella flava]|uniref:DUF4167 domain-containing protein n=1 Tax=Allosphingosinicella flava TaxID=2771430 RepID=A0A7T2GIZ0_9SPHN|nr:DUF4167 domain-containing protein [Sphingosinicella flava]QPQ54749.1 DUF4167 domain-containing protein [Sphingosinicella flava]